LIFSVREGPTTHIAALFGGTVLRASNAMPEAQQYLQSLEHFGEIAKQVKVDVEVHNHRLYDNTFEKGSCLEDLKAGRAVPLRRGEASYSRFVDVMTECMKAAIARK
jgi:hypothetical protein